MKDTPVFIATPRLLITSSQSPHIHSPRLPAISLVTQRKSEAASDKWLSMDHPCGALASSCTGPGAVGGILSVERLNCE